MAIIGAELADDLASEEPRALDRDDIQHFRLPRVLKAYLLLGVMVLLLEETRKAIKKLT